MIGPDEWNMPQTVSVCGIDDNEVDGDKMFYVWAFKTQSDDPKFVDLTQGLNGCINTDNASDYRSCS